MCLTYYPVTFHDQLGRPMRKRRASSRPQASAAASDGLVGLGSAPGSSGSTSAPWSVIRSGWRTRRCSSSAPRWPRRSTPGSPSTPSTRCSTSRRRSASRTRRSSTARTPTTIEHFRTRATFVDEPTRRRRQPRPAVPAASGRLRPPNQHRDSAITPSLRVAERRSAAPHERAARFAVQRAAGPRHDGVLGRSVRRASAGAAGRRGHPPRIGHTGPTAPAWSAACRRRSDQFWERGPIFAALNTNKKSLDDRLQRPTWASICVRRFVGDLRRRRRELHATRARPARSGLRVAAEVDGPISSWCGCRGSGSTDRGANSPAFAFVIEDASGLTWLTGHPDLLPVRAVLRRRPERRAARAVRPAARARAPRQDRRGRPGRGGDGRRRAQRRRRAGDRALGLRRAAEPRRATGDRAQRRRTSTKRRVPTTTAATTPGSRSRSPPTSSGASLRERRGPRRSGRTDPVFATAAGRRRAARPDRRASAGVVPGAYGRRHRRLPVGRRCSGGQGDAAAPPAGPRASSSPATSSRSWTIR